MLICMFFQSELFCLEYATPNAGTLYAIREPLVRESIVSESRLAGEPLKTAGATSVPSLNDQMSNESWLNLFLSTVSSLFAECVYIIVNLFAYSGSVTIFDGIGVNTSFMFCIISTDLWLLPLLSISIKFTLSGKLNIIDICALATLPKYATVELPNLVAWLVILSVYRFSNTLQLSFKTSYILL